MLVVVVSLATLGITTAVGADSATEGQFLSKINASRSAAGLAPLTTNGNLQSYARSHSAEMANADKIYHSTASQLRAAAGSGWTALGENVGRGQSPDSLHAKFMESPGHRANILGDYNQVGIGTVSSGPYLYVTVVFMKKGSTSSGGSTGGSGSKSTSTTKAPTTTIPTTTTTTLIVPPDRPVIPGSDCVAATRFWQLCFD